MSRLRKKTDIEELLNHLTHTKSWQVIVCKSLREISFLTDEEIMVCAVINTLQWVQNSNQDKFIKLLKSLKSQYEV